MRHRVIARCILPIALLAAHATAGAQVINGRVTSEREGTVVAGAIVALVDSAGHVVETRLAEDSGTFHLTAPREGRYAVRVERVGFHSTVSALVLVRSGETLDVPVRIASESVSLRALRVSADRRCLVRPQEGLAAAQLWDEARKALSATQLTQLAQATARTRHDPHRFAVRVRKFSRDRSQHSLAILEESSSELEGDVITPFVTAPPDALERDGYVIGTVENGRTYFAPDAAILLSDRFLDSHCFRLEEPERGNDALIGLAFEPVRLTNRDDPAPVNVRGVLWLDRATAELRYMDFDYTNLPSADHANGQIEFRPLPDGRWIVWRWYIRMPRYERRQILGDGIRPTQFRLEVAALREDGAEILSVSAPTRRRSRLAVLHGSVTDSTRGAPIAGARVFLSGTSFAAVTDSAGQFTIDSIAPGRYVASVLTPRLDSLLLEPPAIELTLGTAETKRLDFAAPSFRTLTAQWCREAASEVHALIVGLVRDTASKLGAGVGVTAEWHDVQGTGVRLQSRPITNGTTSTDRGRYALCGLPLERGLTIRARQGEQVTTTLAAPLSTGEVRRLDLTLRRP